MCIDCFLLEIFGLGLGCLVGLLSMIVLGSGLLDISAEELICDCKTKNQVSFYFDSNRLYRETKFVPIFK